MARFRSYQLLLSKNLHQRKEITFWSFGLLDQKFTECNFCVSDSSHEKKEKPDQITWHGFLSFEESFFVTPVNLEILNEHLIMLLMGNLNF